MLRFRTTPSDHNQTASEKQQLKESLAAAAMEQDSIGAETEKEIIVRKQKLQRAKAERHRVKERWERATQKEEEARMKRKRLEREFQEAEMRVRGGKKKLRRLEWDLEERQYEGLSWELEERQYEGLRFGDTLMGAFAIGVLIGAVIGCLAAVDHAGQGAK